MRDRFLWEWLYHKLMKNDLTTAVLYNAQCPVCYVEVGHYERYACEAGLPIRFDDLNIDAWEQKGLDYNTAARRLYVDHDGVLTSGIPAFLVLWAQMPRYRFLGRLLGSPGIKQLATVAYDHVFAPALYRSHLRRLRKQATRTGS